MSQSLPWAARRHRGLFWIAVVIALVAAGGGAVYAYGVYADGTGPDGAVRSYLHAVARGDAPAALAMGTIGTGDSSYLTSAVLAEQLHIAPMMNISIVSVEKSGSTAKVSYSYSLGFARGALKETGSVGVHKDGGRWRLDAVAVAGMFQLGEAVDRASFAGTEVPEALTLLFPGAVPLSFDSPYLRLSLDTEEVHLGETGTIQLTAQLTDSAETLIVSQLQRLLTACVQVGKTAPANCPLPTGQYVPGSLKGKVTLSKSDVLVDVNADPAGSVAISGTAHFTGSYRELSFDNVGHNHSGHLTLELTAQAYTVTPLVVHFQEQI